MANSLLTIDMITRKGLAILENNLVLSRNINRQYDDSFAVEGAKIGSSLRIRLPDRVLVTDGAALQTQDDNEQYTTLTVSSQKHVGINFTSAELSMQLDDFADRVLKPRISQLASSIDADVANVFASVGNSVGTPGTTPATALVMLQAQQKMNEAAAPMSPRYLTVNPAANAALVNGLSGFFNPSDSISRQFKSGMMGENVLGYEEVNMSQSVKSFTVGSRTATGGHDLGHCDRRRRYDHRNHWCRSFWYRQGRRRVHCGRLLRCQSADAGVHWFTVPVRRAGGRDSGRFRCWHHHRGPDVLGGSPSGDCVESSCCASRSVTFLGAASTTYPQNIAYHKDAFTLATADLILPQGVDMASRANHNGISMRIVRQYDINNDRMPCRVDVLYGYAAIRPQLACRVWG
jgi:hypothetical protein